MNKTKIGILALQLALLVIAILGIYTEYNFSTAIAAIAGVNCGLIIKEFRR